MLLSTATAPGRRRLGAAGVLTAAGLALTSLSLAPAQAAEAGPSARAAASSGVSAQAAKVAAKKGKIIRLSGKRPGCRVHAVVSVTKNTASGYLKSTCEYGTDHVLTGLLSIDNKKLKTVTKRQRGGKTSTTKTVKLSNPKGTQNICMIGSWNFPLTEHPAYRSEARACVTY